MGLWGRGGDRSGSRAPNIHVHPPAKNNRKKKVHNFAIDEKDVVHPPGVEPGPIAWKAIILPLDQECLMEEKPFKYNM